MDTSRRIADIELLRGIAVLFVIVHHARGNLIIWPNAGFDGLYQYVEFWPGVDLFFAISGFVIARSLLPTLDLCRTKIEFFSITLSFWIRRAARLLPSAWLWLAVLLFAAAAFDRSGVFGSIEANIAATVAGLLNFANFRFAKAFMQFEYGASFVYWSLSLEEQFYFLLPIAAFLCRRWLSVLLGTLVLLQLFSSRTLLLMSVRTDAILLGVLLAIWSQHASYRLFDPTGLASSRLARVATMTFLLGAIAVLASESFQPISARIGLIALLATVLVLIASYNRNYLWQPGPTKRMMMSIGSRSYGLYLIHIPAFFLTREIWYRLEPPGTVFDGTFGMPFVLTATALLLLLSELNYRLVEVPLRARGARFAERIARQLLASQN